MSPLKNLRTIFLFGSGAALVVLLLPTAGESQSEEEAVAITDSSTSPSKSPKTDVAGSKAWPSRDLDQTIAYNPFLRDGRAPTSAVAPGTENIAANASATTSNQTEAITAAAKTAVSEQHRASIILRSSVGNAAMVGRRIMHEGDRIDGMTVSKIKRDEVLYAPSER